MSPIRIGGQEPVSGSHSPWTQHGLLGNPFPSSGVETVADYDEHQSEQVRLVNAWLTSTVSRTTRQWPPLVLKGSVGVGKTHILRRMERVLLEYRDSDLALEQAPATLVVSSHTLPGISSRTLLLSNILQEGLRSAQLSRGGDPEAADFPLLRECLRYLRENPGDELAIPQNSPIIVPLRRYRSERNPTRQAEMATAIVGWVSRRDIGRSMADRIGVRGRLEGEGESVRAYAHLAALAKQCVNLRAWIVLLDQIEDLWRANEVTPVKRARFLTDLRTLIDESLAGVPVAIVLAWNTDVVDGSRRRSIDAESPLRTEYVALWSRLPAPIDIPPLPPEHVLPFANAYVNVAHQAFLAASSDRNRSSPHPARFTSALTANLSELLRRVPDYGRLHGGAIIERLWLRTLREWADEFVRGPKDG
jgi:hypothetical protein